MDNISYIGLSQQMALQRLMEVTANNIANMSTPGFKSQNVLFKEYLNAPPKGGDKVSQVQDYGTYRDLAQGTLTQTHNNLDVAVQGEGYFAVRTPGGIMYTRDGSFSLNSRGEIVTKAGYQVMSESDNPLTVQQKAAQIAIASDGSVSSEKGTIGKMKLVTFGNEQMLVPIGDNTFDARSALEQPVEKPQIVQGMLENANVQPVMEMNKMIEIMRLYQATQSMLMADHEQQRNVIQRLTRI